MSEWDDLLARAREKPTPSAPDLGPNPPTSEQAAKAMEIEAGLGVPAASVLGDALPTYDDVLKKRRMGAALGNAPRLNATLADNLMLAALAQNDLEALADLEGSLVGRRGQQFTEGAADVVASVPEAHAVRRQQVDEAVREQAPEQAREFARQARVFQDILREGVSPSSGAALSDDERATYQQRLADAQAGLRAWMERAEAGVIPASRRAGFRAGEAVREGVASVVGKPDPRDTSFWAQVARGAGSMTALAGIAAATGPAALPVGAKLGADMNAAGLYKEAIEAGASETDALRASQWGSIVGATEIIPIGRALKLLPPRLRKKIGGGFMRRFADIAQGAGEEAAQEYLATVANNIIAQNLFDAERGWLDGAGEAALVGAVLGGGTGAVGTTLEMRRASRAGRTQRDLEGVDQIVGGVSFKEAAPRAFERIAEGAGLGDADISVRAEDLREFYQDGLDLDAFGIDEAVFEDALASGGDVSITAATYAAKISGKDEAAFWKRHGVFSDDEMSMAEVEALAERFNDDVREIMEQARAEADAGDADAAASRPSDVQVYDAIHSQLRAAGRSPDVAEREARVWSSFFRTMGERYGDDALDLMQSFGIEVRGPESPVAGRRRSAIDASLNTLRTEGDKALKPSGLSLTEFIADIGGIQDVGGDFGALEGPKGLVAETAGDVAARLSEPTLDGTPAQGRGRGADEVARAAQEAGFFAGVDEADLVGALLEAVRGEVGGNPVYVDGEGPNADMVALAEALEAAGVDLGAMDNDAAVAALRAADDPRILYQDGNRLYQSKDGAVSLDALAGEGDDQAIIAKALVDSSGFDAEYLSNVFEGVPLRSEHDSLLDVPSLLRVMPMMRTAIAEQPQVVDSIVGLAPVNVVDMLFGSEASAKMALHDEAMLQNGSAFDTDLAVASALGDTSRSVRLFVLQEAIPAAKAAFVSLNSRLIPTKNGSALVAREVNSFGQDGKRASIVFPSGGITSAHTIINLFEGNDLSSFLHESGHFFLEAFTDIAGREGAPQQMRDDLAVIRKYLQNEGGKYSTDQHETWARATEAYFMEGKAPSLELADAFARFKTWLTRIYRSIAGLDVKLSPEVREVMDRMLATDDEIAAARDEAAMNPMFADAASAGMTDAEYAPYERLARRSVEQAQQKLMEKTLAKVRREREKWFKTEKAAVRAEVTAQAERRREYRLINLMANGVWDGEGDAPDIRLNRSELVEMFGAGVIKEIDRARLGGKRAIYADDGENLGVVAEMFGFANEVEMVEVLQNTLKMKDFITGEVDRIMDERHGDPLNDGSIEEEALAAVHSEQQSHLLASEARHLAKRAGRDGRNITSRIFRQRAVRMIGAMKVKDAIRPARFLEAERRAARDAAKEFAKVTGTATGGRADAGAALTTAHRLKEQQLLNHHLYMVSRDLEQRIARKREKMRAYDKKSVREKLAGDYIEQIDGLLEQYDFRVVGLGQLRRRAKLSAYVDQMIEDGRAGELAIDPRLIDDARQIHYSQMTVDEIEGLFDTIANIDHMGRYKQTLIEKARKRDLMETVEGMVGQIRINLGTGKSQQRDAISRVNFLWVTDTMLLAIDGGDEMGVAYEAIKGGIDDGASVEVGMQRGMAQKMEGLFGVYSKREIADMQKPKSVAGANGRPWAKSEILAVALNTGNDANKQRLFDKNVHERNRLTQDQADALLSTLDKRDWEFVQSMWDLIDSFWPEMAAVTKRRTGVEPKKVEPAAVVNEHGVFRGGYYPIKYDPALGAKELNDSDSAWDKFVSMGWGAKAETASGFTKERQSTGGGRTLRLDMSVAFAHMRDTIRYISLSEAVDASYKVLNHPETVNAFLDAGRAEDLETMKLWLKDVAEGPVFNTDLLNSFARIVKNNFTLSRLAFNVKTTILQVTGVAQSAAVIGKRNMVKGYRDYLRRPAAMVEEVRRLSPFMAERQTTFQKDIYDFANDVELSSPLASRWKKGKTKVAQAGFAPIVVTQFYAVDMPTWLGAFNAEIERGGDQARAVRYADRMVARAQDSGLLSDRAGVERGTLSAKTRQSDFVRLTTTLGGYMLKKLNRGRATIIKGTAKQETTAKQIAAAANMATDLTLLFVVEGAMMALIFGAAADDEVEDEDYAAFLLRETGMAVVGGIPLVRDAASAFSGFGAGGVQGSVLEIPARIWAQAVQGENDKALRRAMADAVGTATGLPTTQPMRMIEAIIDSDDTPMIEGLIGTNPLTR